MASWLQRLTRAGPILWLAFVDRVVQTPKPKPFIAFAQQRAAADDAHYMPLSLCTTRSCSGYCELLWAPNLSFRLRSAARGMMDQVGGTGPARTKLVMTKSQRQSDILRTFLPAKVSRNCGVLCAELTRTLKEGEMGHCQTFNSP